MLLSKKKKIRKLDINVLFFLIKGDLNQVRLSRLNIYSYIYIFCFAESAAATKRIITSWYNNKF